MDRNLQEKNEQPQKAKFALELIKAVDRFLDGYCNFTSNLVTYKLKSLCFKHFLKPNGMCESQLVVQIDKITDIINPTAIRKPTKRRTALIIREAQIEPYLHSPIN